MLQLDSGSRFLDGVCTLLSSDTSSSLDTNLDLKDQVSKSSTPARLPNQSVLELNLWEQNSMTPLESNLLTRPE
jgi:hypothetical protein